MSSIEWRDQPHEDVHNGYILHVTFIFEDNYIMVVECITVPGTNACQASFRMSDLQKKKKN